MAICNAYVCSLHRVYTYDIITYVVLGVLNKSTKEMSKLMLEPIIDYAYKAHGKYPSTIDVVVFHDYMTDGFVDSLRKMMDKNTPIWKRVMNYMSSHPTGGKGSYGKHLFCLLHTSPIFRSMFQI